MRNTDKNVLDLLFALSDFDYDDLKAAAKKLGQYKIDMDDFVCYVNELLDGEYDDNYICGNVYEYILYVVINEVEDKTGIDIEHDTKRHIYVDVDWTKKNGDDTFFNCSD